MQNYTLGYAEPCDLEQLSALWSASFGDSEDFVKAFFSVTNCLQSTVVLKEGGLVRSMMISFDGITLCGQSASYFYALCTYPDSRSRGFGSAALRESIRRAKARGFELTFLRPENALLAKGYIKSFNAKPLRYLSQERFYPGADGASEVKKIPASTYAKLCHISMPKALINAQELMCGYYNCAFYQIGDCAIHAAFQNGEYVVKSFFGPSENRDRAVSCLCRQLGIDYITLEAQSHDANSSLYPSLLYFSDSGIDENLDHLSPFFFLD